jgi:uncharacterized protein (TIGR02217 family)
MAFIESPRFPEYLAPGMVGGPSWRTEIVELMSGHEQRNAAWALPRQRYRINVHNLTQTQIEGLIAFMRITQGRLNGFRFRDPADYAAAGSAGVVTLISGNDYQLYKRYTSGANTADRKIIKPVRAISVAGGGTYSVNYTTGVVTRSSGAVPTGWTGSFDVPVRFGIDEMAVDVHRVSVGGSFSWDVELVELRQ